MVSVLSSTTQFICSFHMQAIITEKYDAQGCNIGEDGDLAPNVSRHVIH